VLHQGGPVDLAENAANNWPKRGVSTATLLFTCHAPLHSVRVGIGLRHVLRSLCPGQVLIIRRGHLSCRFRECDTRSPPCHIIFPDLEKSAIVRIRYLVVSCRQQCAGRRTIISCILLTGPSRIHFAPKSAPLRRVSTLLRSCCVARLPCGLAAGMPRSVILPKSTLPIVGLRQQATSHP
jgi:hypothetical protein